MKLFSQEQEILVDSAPEPFTLANLEAHADVFKNASLNLMRASHLPEGATQQFFALHGKYDNSPILENLVFLIGLKLSHQKLH